MSGTPLRVGLAGMGAAGQAFVAPLQQHRAFDWVAFAEPDGALRGALAHTHGVAGYADFEALLAHPGLDALLIATPTPLHAAQAVRGAAAGLHLLVEKPMATTLADARAMCEAAERAGVLLLVGHSHGYDAPVAAMRAVIDSGEIGPVGMVQHWCYTDWIWRPRRADELDAALGGGVTFRQGSHQFDILRLLCGGLARSVRAKVFDWAPQRRAIGAHTVFIDFEDGPAATAVYNGYGGFSSMDLCFDISEWGLHQPPGQRPRLPWPPAGGDEAGAKRARAARAIAASPAHAPMFGLTLVSCAQGDMRQAADTLQLHTPAGMRELPLNNDRGPRDRVLDEWHAAISGRSPPLHSGRWGLANLEICVAAIESSRTRREVGLSEQIALAAQG